ncbi:MAG: sigma-70 family RNA polymerase sigma factor [Polyangiaceae bacterium]|jgi:RNA polymerase sigma-70 factor, ECF subfamily|nr:sigma-70 family RNA polymerase sigma factor [Polyangiaceae bacterium]
MRAPAGRPPTSLADDGEPRDVGDEGSAHLGRILGELFERGRAAWPQINVSAPIFSAHLKANLGGEASAEGLRDLCAEDLYLACACAQGDPGALAAFEQHFLARVGTFLSRMRPSSSFVDEVKQGLRIKLLLAAPEHRPKIAEYSGRGSLQGWLRVGALRTAIDLRRQRGEAGDGVELGSSGDGGAEAGGLDAPRTHRDPELDYIRERYRHVFKEAFQSALSALSSEQRNVLRLYLVDGMTIDQIGALFHIHRATVARWIAAARVDILKETQKLLRERLQASAAEIDSLTRLVQSELDVSIARLLHDNATRR